MQINDNLCHSVRINKYVQQINYNFNVAQNLLYLY